MMEHESIVSKNRVGAAQRMSFRADKPFNDLPQLPPKADVENRVVLKTRIEARAVLVFMLRAVPLAA